MVEVVGADEDTDISSVKLSDAEDYKQHITDLEKIANDAL